MMLIDHISTKQSDSAGQDKNLTATIGLVVHAAGLFIKTKVPKNPKKKKLN